jgi:hypothetical protein
MNRARYDRIRGVTYLRIPVDDATAAWLAEVAESCHGEMEMIAAAILRDVKDDDELAHLHELAPPPSRGGRASLN